MMTGRSRANYLSLATSHKGEATMAKKASRSGGGGSKGKGGSSGERGGGGRGAGGGKGLSLIHI